MLDRFRVFGVTSLRGACYFSFIGIVALVFSLATRYIGISWGPPLFVGTTIFAATFPVLFFFGSLKGIHNIIVEVKTSELYKLRTEYWNAHQAFNQRYVQRTNGDNERTVTMLSLKIEELGNAIKWIERIPDWPLDFGIIRLLGVSVIFPLATSFLGNYLIGMHP
jgi:hypothetical protein